MLHPIALKDGDAAVAAADGQRDREAAARVFRAVADCVREVDRVGGLIELAARHSEDVGVVEAGDDGFGHGLVWLTGVWCGGAKVANGFPATEAELPGLIVHR